MDYVDAKSPDVEEASYDHKLDERETPLVCLRGLNVSTLRQMAQDKEEKWWTYFCGLTLPVFLNVWLIKNGASIEPCQTRGVCKVEVSASGSENFSNLRWIGEVVKSLERIRKGYTICCYVK